MHIEYRLISYSSANVWTFCFVIDKLHLQIMLCCKKLHTGVCAYSPVSSFMALDCYMLACYAIEEGFSIYVMPSLQHGLLAYFANVFT